MRLPPIDCAMKVPELVEGLKNYYRRPFDKLRDLALCTHRARSLRYASVSTLSAAGAAGAAGATANGVDVGASRPANRASSS